VLGVALRSLVYDGGKATASVIGVTCAACLLFIEVGLYFGLAETSSALVRRANADVWIVARGTEVLDNGQPLPTDAIERLRGVSCVTRAREMVLATLPVQKRSGALDYVQVVGADPSATPPLPWSWSGARAPIGGLDMSVDSGDLAKLELPADPRGVAIRVGTHDVRVVGVTEGIRSFALVPYVFTDLPGARTLAGIGSDTSTYLLANVRDASCIADIRRAFAGVIAIDAHSSSEFAEMTERFWMEGSGAGATIAASAVFSLVVGAIIVGQTLYSITRDHLRELATLKAMGARTTELVAFVALQTATLASVGGACGALVAAALGRILAHAGVNASLSRQVVAIGVAAIVFMCIVAALPSILRVRRVSALEVLQ
jgi:putative ABC transport system permease protein